MSISITKEEKVLGEKRSKELHRIYKKNKATECKISFEFDVVIESNNKVSKTKTLSYEVFFNEDCKVCVNVVDNDCGCRRFLFQFSEEYWKKFKKAFAKKLKI